MKEIKFKYDPWDDAKDQLLVRAGSELSFGILQSATEIGHPPTVKVGQKRLSGQTVDGVIGLLAASLQYLRWYGLTLEDVQARVQRITVNNKDTKSRKLLLQVQKYRRIDDSRNVLRLLNPNNVVR